MTQSTDHAELTKAPPPDRNWKVAPLKRSEAMRQNMDRVAAFRSTPSLLGKETPK